MWTGMTTMGKASTEMRTLRCTDAHHQDRHPLSFQWNTDSSSYSYTTTTKQKKEKTSMQTHRKCITLTVDQSSHILILHDI